MHQAKLKDRILRRWFLLPLRKRRPKSSDVVAIFAKPPIPGLVKTRLQKLLGPQRAAELHYACLQDAVRLLSSVPGVERCLCVAGSAPQARQLARRLHLGRGWKYQTQGRGDLGEKLSRTFAGFLRGGVDRLVVIGTDTPWMGTRAIAAALRALKTSVVVLGPARDGGYYLVGAGKLVPGMFRGVDWGTARVYRQTLAALRRTGIRPAVLRKGFDLDRPADLARLIRGRARLRRTAPALAALLGNLARKKTG